jgi:predicted ATPase
MITSLELEGFKSFGSPGVKLRLGPLNFLVGPNASGKTNLLSGLRFLQSAIRQDVEFAVNDFGGPVEVRNKILRERKKAKPVKIGVRWNPDPVLIGLPDKGRWLTQSFDYSIEVNLRHDDKLPAIESESLRMVITKDNNEVQQFVLNRDSEKVTITDPMGTLPNRQKQLEVKIPKQEATRLAVGVGFFAPACVLVREEINGWRFFNVSPRVAREPCKDLPELDLGMYGENLAAVLHKIEQNGEVDKNAILSGLRNVVPGFKGIKTKQLPVEGKWAFQVLEDRIKSAINPASVSDGTIRLLTLLVITTWTAKHSSLIAMEEPENGVHPHLSEHIVEILRTASEKQQILATTHNPRFLDYLKPDEIILCDKIDGFTQMKHAADVKDIELFQKRFRLGELWEQGVLGGTP